MNSACALQPIARPFTRSTRRALRANLLSLLSWQRRLDRFSKPRRAPDATPIVSLYSRGFLRGCAANNEGAPGERLARAFLLALGDLRFGGLAREDRRAVVAQVAYPKFVRRVSLDAAPRVIAPGSHGLALALGQGFPVLLVPEVAREHELDATGLLEALERKAEVPVGQWPLSGLYLFETEAVVARGTRAHAAPSEPVEAAVRWLAARVGADGAVAFGLDPRSGAEERVGPMLHGRAAVVVQALGVHPAGRQASSRARRWLELEIQKGLSGGSRGSWPEDAALVAGTLGLAQLAGLDVKAPLRELARASAVENAPWHAGQVACALGRDAPDALWRACLRSLDTDPRAPWIAMAAARREAWDVVERVANALAASVREHGPQRGGVGTGSVPELALTALTVEALAPVRDDSAQRALVLALSFIERSQIVPDTFPEASDTRRVSGAFPLTPIHRFLRADVTAHAVLAMSAAPK